MRRLPRRNFNLSHTDKDSYKGPIVLGWDPQRNRIINDYLPKNENVFTVLPRHVDPLTTDMLFIIKTRVDGFSNRNRTRSLWGKLLHILKPSARVIFIIGRTDLNSLNTKRLNEEINTHGDILQVNVSDSYYNLTLKTLAAHKFVVDKEWILEPEYVMILDDDMFLNVPLFLRKMKEMSDQCQGPLLHGYFSNNYFPVQDGLTQKLSSRWGAPSYMLVDKVYPAYVYGVHVTMSHETVKCLYEVRGLMAHNINFGILGKLKIVGRKGRGNNSRAGIQYHRYGIR
ncbi:Hexosyltransferase [Caligus rogercresseyi]|uniref:Hexosyltransferase n=1 Tax=Caligus rogercresseyi TaxID=217165 RepID=A0A7T8JW30_CALRO|nr:Hexosyltransferase [Caligus rogercresseyi]